MAHSSGTTRRPPWGSDGHGPCPRLIVWVLTATSNMPPVRGGPVAAVGREPETSRVGDYHGGAGADRGPLSWSRRMTARGHRPAATLQNWSKLVRNAELLLLISHLATIILTPIRGPFLGAAVRGRIVTAARKFLTSLKRKRGGCFPSLSLQACGDSLLPLLEPCQKAHRQ